MPRKEVGDKTSICMMYLVGPLFTPASVVPVVLSVEYQWKRLLKKLKTKKKTMARRSSVKEASPRLLRSQRAPARLRTGSRFSDLPLETVGDLQLRGTSAYGKLIVCCLGTDKGPTVSKWSQEQLHSCGFQD